MEGAMISATLRRKEQKKRHKLGLTAVAYHCVNVGSPMQLLMLLASPPLLLICRRLSLHWSAIGSEDRVAQVVSQGEALVQVVAAASLEAQVVME